MLKNINSIYEYESQLQEKLQEEYDRICSNLIYAKKNDIKEYWNECLWKKEEIENISKSLNIHLLKERTFEDIYRMAENISNFEEKKKKLFKSKIELKNTI